MNPTLPTHVDSAYTYGDRSDINQTDGCANLERMDPWVIHSPLVNEACIYTRGHPAWLLLSLL